MGINTLLTTLAVVAGLFGASASASAENGLDIKSYKPIEPPTPFWYKFLPSPHIVGGNEATPHSHPHQVILLVRTENSEGVTSSGLCGGSLLSDSWVITAAHCVDKGTLIKKPKGDLNDYKISVKVGVGLHSFSDLGKSKNVEVVEATDIIVHQEWMKSGILANDIAVLKLHKSVNLDGENAKSIRLPKLSEKGESYKGSDVTITGWGLTYTKGSFKLPESLQTANTKVIGNFYCNFRHLFLLVRSTHICTTGADGQSTCQGDSGGPLIIEEADGEPTLIGITSFGIGCRWGFPSVFTRITSFLGWIHEKTNLPPRY